MHQPMDAWSNLNYFVCDLFNYILSIQFFHKILKAVNSYHIYHIYNSTYSYFPRK